MGKVQSTYASGFLLEIEGEKASQKLLEDILHISVDESLSLPGAFTLVIKNAKFPGTSDEEIWTHGDVFKIGTSIKIGFTPNTADDDEASDNEEAYILAGEVTGVETHFTEGSQAPIIIRGYDVSHRLHRGRYNRSFQNMTDTDIVKKIANEAGITLGTVDNSGSPHDYVFQQNQTNMAFLRERAFRNGFELFIQDGKLFFRKSKKGDTLELEWLKTLSSFQVRITSAEQIQEVEVRGWDYQKKQPIVATQSKKQLITQNDYGPGSKHSNVFDDKPNDPKLIVVDRPVFSVKEAEKIAQALFDEFSGEFVQADAKAEGNPKIRPGSVVKLKEMGKYDGEYYVTETRHLSSERHYVTEFSVRGLRGGNLLSALRPANALQPGQTLLVGRVTNNNDPDGLGRVRVKFPTLTEEHESNWARVVAIGAGPDRGLDCLPEIDDEVLVGFEHGDIHRPYVMGNVWNGEDKPPAPVGDSVVDNKVRLRTLKTRTGHTLQFVEEDKGSSKKGIYIETVYGHHIYFNDSEQVIEIKTGGGHTFTLDDRGKQVQMKTSGGHSITMSDTSQSLDIQSTGNMNIKAAGIMTLQGSLIKLN